MSWILLTPAEHYPFKKLKLTWFYGIDAIELADGDFVFPDRVYPDIRNLISQGKITEHEVEDNKVKVKYLDGSNDEQEIEIDFDDLNQFSTTENPNFKEPIAQ